MQLINFNTFQDTKRVMIIAIFSTISLILFFLSVNKVVGEVSYFCIFSLLSSILMITVITQKNSIGFMFFSFLIYLGFFVKHTLHLILMYDYLEPIGKFDNSYSNWNEFYQISSIGILSFIILGMYLNFFHKKLSYKTSITFISFRKLNIFWLVLILFAVFLLIVNEVFQVQKLGIEKIEYFDSRYFEISIILLISIVFPIFMYCISFYEITQRNNYYKTIFFVMIISSLFSISILSRSVIVFWCMPLLFLPLFKKINLKQYVYMILLYLSFVYFTVGVSTSVRSNSKVSSVSTFKRLVIDRWIGVEGLMVVIGIENKNINNMFYERRDNEIDFFTKNALNYKIQKEYITTSYATLPGIIGFLYLSGSKSILFIGCLLFGIYIIFIEKIVLKFTQNYLLSTYLALSTSAGIAGFGIDLNSWIKVQLLTLFTVFILNLLIKEKL